MTINTQASDLELPPVSLGDERDLSDIHAAIEVLSCRLGWLKPLHPDLETALRNLAKRSPLARYEPHRSTFSGLLMLLEWPELARLEERLRAKCLELTDRANQLAGKEK